jgi:hypothetical protein
VVRATQFSLSNVDPQMKIVWSKRNPCAAHGLVGMARIDELIARGKVVDAPLTLAFALSLRPD